MTQVALSVFLLLISDLIIINTVYWLLFLLGLFTQLQSNSVTQSNIPKNLSTSRKQLGFRQPAETSWFQLRLGFRFQPTLDLEPLDLLP